MVSASSSGGRSSFASSGCGIQSRTPEAAASRSAASMSARSRGCGTPSVVG